MKNMVSIRHDYPGGNVTVGKIDLDGGVIYVEPDMRDSSGRWFHWDFTVEGAEGRTLRFQFPDGYEYLPSLGPAISADGGRTWRWLRQDGSRHEPANAFSHTFGPDEGRTRFSSAIPYAQCDWDAFLARIGPHSGALPGVLCPSQSGRRDTELLRIPCSGEAAWLFVFTARHHACESSANPALEGIVEGVLGDTAEGRAVRECAECVFVPFMDKDGVEDGDQGKNRRPHDHNRDYAEERYTSVRALKRLVEKESRGRRLVFLDLHSPHVRSLPSCPEQDHAFTFGSSDAAINANWNRFRAELAALQKGCALAYDGAFDIHAGEGYDRQCAEERRRGLVSARDWATTVPGCFLATTIEFGYSLCDGVYTADGAREMGRNILRAVWRATRG